MNRQQKRASLRDKEKRINKGLVDLKKNAKTKAEIENYNVAKWAMELSEKEKAYMNKLMIDSSKVDMMCFENAWNIVLSANYSKETVEELTSLVIEEGFKFNEHMENGGDYIMAIKNNANKIIEDYKKGKQNNVKESELIKDLATNYKITINAVKGIIKEHKKELQDPEKALDYIFGEEEKKHIEKFGKATCKQSSQVDKDLKKEYKFKVEEPKVFNAVGEYATYTVNKVNKTITVGEFKFKTESDVTKAYKETGESLKADYKSKQQELLAQYEEGLKNAEESAEETIAAVKQYLV